MQPGVVAHACNPSTWEAETGGLQVRSQPQQFSETLFQNKKKINKIGLGVYLGGRMPLGSIPSITHKQKERPRWEI